MHPDYHEIMASEYNRTARFQEAQKHRLLVAAGVYADRQQARQRIVRFIISKFQRMMGKVAAIPENVAAISAEMGEAIRDTSEMPKAT